MNKDRIVKFAGIMNVDGKVSLCTSNKPKYAVWCDMPENFMKNVSFSWFKLDDDTTLAGAVDSLITRYSDMEQSKLVRDIIDMLKSIATKWQPKAKKIRKKVTRKNAKVSVTNPDKKLSDVEARNAKDLVAAKILARIGQ